MLRATFRNTTMEKGLGCGAFNSVLRDILEVGHRDCVAKIYRHSTVARRGQYEVLTKGCWLSLIITHSASAYRRHTGTSHLKKAPRV